MTPGRSQPRWVRLRALLVLGLLLGTGVASSDALWTSQSDAGASFRAGTVPAPALTQACQYQPGVLGIGARVRIFWSLPDGYALEDAEVRASTSGLGSVLAPLTGFSLSTNTQRQSDGTYRTDVPTNLLGGLLGLGSELEIAIRLVPASAGGWSSASASVASNAGLLAGIGGNCRNLR